MSPACGLERFAACRTGTRSSSCRAPSSPASTRINTFTWRWRSMPLAPDSPPAVRRQTAAATWSSWRGRAPSRHRGGVRHRRDRLLRCGPRELRAPTRHPRGRGQPLRPAKATQQRQERYDRCRDGRPLGAVGDRDSHPLKTADGAAEMVRQIKIARDTAVKARSAALITLKSLIVNASDALRESLDPLTDKKLIDRCAAFDPVTSSTPRPRRSTRSGRSLGVGSPGSGNPDTRRRPRRDHAHSRTDTP